MHLHRNQRLLLLTSALILAYSRSLHGQVVSTDTSQGSHWITAGVGITRWQNRPGFGFEIGYSNMFSSGLFSARFRYFEMTLTKDPFLPNERQVQDITELGGLYGLQLQQGWFCFCASGGIAMVATKEQNNGVIERFYSIALPIESQLLLEPLSFLGIGISLFANLNSKASFSGVALSVQIGRLR